MKYGIEFHQNIDEDVLLFSRVKQWHKKDRQYTLKSIKNNNKHKDNNKDDKSDYNDDIDNDYNLYDDDLNNGYQQQLVLKKDGQLIVKNI